MWNPFRENFTSKQSEKPNYDAIAPDKVEPKKAEEVFFTSEWTFPIFVNKDAGRALVRDISGTVYVCNIAKDKIPVFMNSISGWSIEDYLGAALLQLQAGDVRNPAMSQEVKDKLNACLRLVYHDRHNIY